MERLIDLGPASAITEGGCHSSGPVTVFRDHGTLHAVGSRCPHMGYPISKGTLRDGVVTCAWHGWEFDLTDGGCYRGACDDLPVYPVEIIDGHIRVRVAATNSSADAERRLRESLLAGDVYLEAKALARLLDADVTPSSIAATVLRHGFAHALAAHRSIQACVEARAVLDAALLTGLMEPDERVATMLQGVRTVGGPLGERAAVTVLPGHPSPERLSGRLAAAVAESSSLGVERTLLTMVTVGTGPDAVAALILDLASRPTFLEQPEILAAAVTALEAGERIGAEGWQVTAALLGWVLGAGRGEPSAEARPALRWLADHAAELATLDPRERGRALDDHAVAALGDARDGAAAVALVVGWFSSGAGWADVLDGLNRFTARRLERQTPGSGGLVPAALEGLRWTHAARNAARRGGRAARVQVAIVLGWHVFASRWLQPGRAWQDKPGEATWDGYAAAVAASDVPTARVQAVTLLSREGCSDEALGRWLAALLHDDVSPPLLDALAATVDGCRRGGEWQPAVAGMVSAVLDGRLRQDVRAAARFGLSVGGSTAGRSPNNGSPSLPP